MHLGGDTLSTFLLSEFDLSASRCLHRCICDSLSLCTQDDLRDTAMLHLCTSAQWAAHEELPRMVLVAAQQVRVFIHPIL